MKTLIAPAILLALLASCRGEPAPRDYQNEPPRMTQTPKSAKETPSANGMRPAAPEPSTGVEGTAGPYKQGASPNDPKTTSVPDQAPATPPPAPATTT